MAEVSCAESERPAQMWGGIRVVDGFHVMVRVRVQVRVRARVGVKVGVAQGLSRELRGSQRARNV